MVKKVHQVNKDLAKEVLKVIMNKRIERLKSVCNSMQDHKVNEKMQ